MEIVERLASDDGAVKLLLQLPDGHRVETVFLKLEDNNKDSLCVSSQVGCALACQFCSTGKLGFKRNMTVAEMVDEVRVSLDTVGFVQTRRFDLSFMGMGEPMQNLRNVLAAKAELAVLYPRFNFHISTVGLPAKIRELAGKDPDFGLQISLHAPTDEARSSILPINQTYPIHEVLEAGEYYAARSPKPVTLNYCFMSGVNDALEQARQLVALVAGRPFKVQLVNFNPHPSLEFGPTRPERAEAFLQMLLDGGLRAHLGRQLGADVGAGCGQLDADYEAGNFRRARKLPA